jgi:hypothetical protein
LIAPKTAALVWKSTIMPGTGATDGGLEPDVTGLEGGVTGSLVGIADGGHGGEGYG